jgi:hypothetical protein
MQQRAAQDSNCAARHLPSTHRPLTGQGRVGQQANVVTPAGTTHTQPVSTWVHGVPGSGCVAQASTTPQSSNTTTPDLHVSAKSVSKLLRCNMW